MPQRGVELHLARRRLRAVIFDPHAAEKAVPKSSSLGTDLIERLAVALRRQITMRAVESYERNPHASLNHGLLARVELDVIAGAEPRDCAASRICHGAR
jgi:hypothetical protein